MNKLFILIFHLMACPLFGDSNRLVAILIDARTEQSLGKFPIDRKYFAQAIDILKSNDAKAVILKFFFDLKKNADTDMILSNSIQKMPVFLQASIFEEPQSNPLDKRFIFTGKDIKVTSIINGNEGWIPMNLFAKSAYAIGFVDANADTPASLPLLEKYRNEYVKTMTLAVLQFAFPDLSISWGKEISTNGKTIRMNEKGEIQAALPSSDSLSFISFIDLVNGKIGKSEIENKIIYLGYDGNEQGMIKTKIGQLKSHRFYYYCLNDIISKLEK